MKSFQVLTSGILAFALLPAAAIAQDWILRADDLKLSDQELHTAIVGQTLIFYDNGQSAFQADGSYAYTYDQGGSALGSYELQDDSTVCIAYQNGFSRCDMYVRNGERLVLLTAKGERFPIRP